MFFADPPRNNIHPDSLGEPPYDSGSFLRQKTYPSESELLDAYASWSSRAIPGSQTGELRSQAEASMRLRLTEEEAKSLGWIT